MTCENGALATVSVQFRPAAATVFLKFYKQSWSMMSSALRSSLVGPPPGDAPPPSKTSCQTGLRRQIEEDNKLTQARMAAISGRSQASELGIQHSSPELAVSAFFKGRYICWLFVCVVLYELMLYIYIYHLTLIASGRTLSISPSACCHALFEMENHRTSSMLSTRSYPNPMYTYTRLLCRSE